ncbi:pyridoxamine 5'-phosphate oxidase family protein [Streptomyces sp. NPDC053427]|uniref:pyridoxamine 5'-phosphate oxidase family protein n=1 Tax=Streptomyces sp. NPDC053427 TaxID=3365701 RepID=UPI0037D6390B
MSEENAVTKDSACPAEIRRALAAHTTMTLAYVDEDGPQAAAVLYAPAQGPVLYFVTSTGTRHGRALAAPGTAPENASGAAPGSASGTASATGGARVAFTAQRDGQEWRGLTGLQGRGRCRPLGDDERAAGWRAYTERFPFVAESESLRAALERTTLWELRPDWLRLIDNGRGFGHKEEWHRAGAA